MPRYDYKCNSCNIIIELLQYLKGLDFIKQIIKVKNDI
jgi:predicted nucleic acid-binding Zn ribbon protein